jgi:hypothetical protein
VPLLRGLQLAAMYFNQSSGRYNTFPSYSNKIAFITLLYGRPDGRRQSMVMV